MLTEQNMSHVCYKSTVGPYVDRVGYESCMLQINSEGRMLTEQNISHTCYKSTVRVVCWQSRMSHASYKLIVRVVCWQSRIWVMQATINSEGRMLTEQNMSHASYKSTVRAVCWQSRIWVMHDTNQQWRPYVDRAEYESCMLQSRAKAVLQSNMSSVTKNKYVHLQRTHAYRTSQQWTAANTSTPIKSTMTKYQCIHLTHLKVMKSVSCDVLKCIQNCLSRVHGNEQKSYKSTTS